jgi:eukaryotic-like serine/threonine-protein kinase
MHREGAFADPTHARPVIAEPPGRIGLRLPEAPRVTARILDRKYQLTRPLGEGAMGAVWEGVQPGINRRVAIKIIKSEWAAKPDLVKRFYREAEAVGRINTPHVVQVYDAGQDPETGNPYLVMEHLVGEDVSALIDRLGGLAPDLALRIAAQGLLGLKAAHDAGIIHRDVKPSNLFLSRKPGGEVIVKLLDFGIAKTAMSPEAMAKGTKLTRTGAPIGSPAYMSPEQAAELKSIDPRTDLWSMGGVLYEALTERTPYAHVESLIQLYREIASGPPRPVQDFAPWVPRDVAAIVHGAMCDRAERFPSAAAMLDAIVKLLPGGYAIHESMLAPMPVDSRRARGERLAPAHSRFSTREAGTHAGLTSSTVGEKKLGTSVVAASAIAGLLVAAAVPSLYWHLTRQKRAGAPIVADASASGSASAAASVGVAPSEPRPLRASVKVSPADATVHVDGAAAEVRDGAVEISGAPGSVHAIKIAAGGREQVTEVVLSTTGAFPAAVALAPEPAPSASAAAKPPQAGKSPAKQPPKRPPAHSTQF